MAEDTLSFQPTHDEAARQGFVGAVKAYANLALHAQLAALADEEILPAYERAHGAPARTREDIAPAVEERPLFKFWGALTYHSQDMLFDSVLRTVNRTKDAEEARARRLTSRPNKRGSLELSPGLAVSEPIAEVEIHRMPGGYVGAADEGDLTAPRLYSGTFEVYRNAKAMGDGSTAGSDSTGLYMASLFERYFPEKSPRRVLDIGCGTGEQTVGLKRAFPDAEVHGLDAAAPLVTFAHAWAESCGVAIAFHQRNAQDTGFADGSFDLIVSHILFHETSPAVLPQVLAEARRLLAPGGVFLNLDVPYQPGVTPLINQVTNNWQVRHNGEPFWTGFANTDLKSKLCEAGFDEANIFHNYEDFGAGKYLAFGGVK
ncbi:MAG: class I SAM-dependent methyltransferase [Caulobacterales bacterium]|nr:class I SAM-dependent methyltransferase [Caulobacterales bacterium]